MAGFVPFRNICADMNCIAFKLILFFNSATSYTRKPLPAMLTDRQLKVIMTTSSPHNIFHLKVSEPHI